MYWRGAAKQTDHMKKEENSQEMFEKEGQCECRSHDDYENWYKPLIQKQPGTGKI